MVVVSVTVMVTETSDFRSQVNQVQIIPIKCHAKKHSFLLVLFF